MYNYSLVSWRVSYAQFEKIFSEAAILYFFQFLNFPKTRNVLHFCTVHTFPPVITPLRKGFASFDYLSIPNSAKILHKQKHALKYDNALWIKLHEKQSWYSAVTVLCCE